MFVLEYDLFDSAQLRHVDLILNWCKQTFSTFTFDITVDLESQNDQGYNSCSVKQYVKLNNEHDSLAFKLKYLG